MRMTRDSFTIYFYFKNTIRNAIISPITPSVLSDIAYGILQVYRQLHNKYILTIISSYFESRAGKE